MKRAIGVAALAGGLLALGAGTAGAQEVSADVSARLGRPTSAEVRVCADGRVLSGLVGSCGGQASSGGTSVKVEAGRAGDGSGRIRASARAPRLASADVSVGTGRSRPRATASGQAAVTPRSQTAGAAAAADTSPRARADATAGRLLDLRPLVSLAGVGVLGSSPFTLAGAGDSLLPTGEPTLDGLTGEAPAGIGVLGSGPIASGNQVGVDVGDVSVSAPVTVCGNGVGVLGDASAGCPAGQPAGGGSGGSSGAAGVSGGSAGPAAVSVGSAGDAPLADLASGDRVAAGIGDTSASAPVTVCGNGVGVLGDASAGCGAGQAAGSGGAGQPSGTAGGSAQTGTSGSQAEVAVDGGSPAIPAVACGDGLGLLGDVSASCGADTSTGGIIAPPPDDTAGQTGTVGTPGDPGSSGTVGTVGTTPGTGDGGELTGFAPLRPSVAGSGALPFTGATGDLLMRIAAGLLAAGALLLRLYPARRRDERRW